MSRVRKNIDLSAKHGRKLLFAKGEPEAPAAAEGEAPKPAPPPVKRKLEFKLPKLPPLADLPPLPQLPEMASDIRSVRHRSALVGGVVIAGLLGMGWRS